MPGAYITTIELDAALPNDVKSARQPEQLTAHTSRVNAELDTALTRAGYTLPITAGITDDVKGRLTDLARYRLALELQLLPEPGDSSGYYLDAKAALAWLELVATGRVALTLTDSSTAGDPGTIDAPESVSLPRRGWEGW